MNKKILLYVSIFLVVISSGILLLKQTNRDNNVVNTKEMTATVLSIIDDNVVIQDDSNIIYTIDILDTKLTIGERIIIEYTGILDKNKEKQDIKITKVSVDDDDTNIVFPWDSNGMFRQFYTLAERKVNSMTLDEKIAQLLLVRYPDNNAVSILKQYNFAGYTFYGKDFNGKTKKQVTDMINELQDNTKIPILTAVDEEGGVVVRISSNTNLASSRFKSPSALYQEGGFDLIRQDTINKSELLHSLGLNLNLAPVVDVATDPSSYMYNRTLQENTELTSTYARTVISASKNSSVSYVLKHFPGYGNNVDTHTGVATDNRTYDDIKDNDLPPFEAGIEAGAEAVLVSHNIVSSVDDVNPASLSTSVHNLLRNELGFTGIIMTDDLSMGATSTIDNNVVKAILAGNDIVMVTDYNDAMNQIRNAINDGTISEDLIDKLAGRVIAWKYYKGLMYEDQK